MHCFVDAKRDEILKKIIKECYWDYDIDIRDLQNILASNNKREIKKLFSKILYNSKDKLLALQLFSKQQLRELFDDFKITYNKKYITKHFLVLRSLLLDEKHKIKSLEWKKI